MRHASYLTGNTTSLWQNYFERHVDGYCFNWCLFADNTRLFALRKTIFYTIKEHLLHTCRKRAKTVSKSIRNITSRKCLQQKNTNNSANRQALTVNIIRNLFPLEASNYFYYFSNLASGKKYSIIVILPAGSIVHHKLIYKQCNRLQSVTDNNRLHYYQKLSQMSQYVSFTIFSCAY